MSQTSHDVRTLNSLIATTIDSIDGYRESAEAATSTRFKEMFLARADERQSVAASLRQQVSALGGNPEDDGTLLAGAHRAFVDLKAAVVGNDDKAVIAEVERGEDHIKAKFEDALKDGELSSDTRSTIESAFTSVKAGHDEITALKHSMQQHA